MNGLRDTWEQTHQDNGAEQFSLLYFTVCFCALKNTSVLAFYLLHPAIRDLIVVMLSEILTLCLRGQVPEVGRLWMRNKAVWECQMVDLEFRREFEE